MAHTERYANHPQAENKLLTQIDGGVRQLLEEMQQGKSERIGRYLEFTARFHRYSVNNQMLIYLQCPHATFVAGYRKWQEMGYQVAQGQKGIRILAPRPYQVTDEETEETHDRIRFVSVAVFDVSQLANVEENPLPVFFTPLADDQQEISARLTQVMEEDNIQVGEESTGLAQGYSSSGHVGVRVGMDSTNRVLTLIHEYAHELLHWDAEGKRQETRVKECHAEAVSYVVAHHFGIHNPFSSDYLQNWGNTPKDLLEELDTVRRTAAYIIDRIEKDKEGSVAEQNRG
jgi:N-terminal domain of anti-restriction factor ArdC